MITSLVSVHIHSNRDLVKQHFKTEMFTYHSTTNHTVNFGNTEHWCLFSNQWVLIFMWPVI